MVRKLRKHNVYMNYPKVAELQADEEHKPVEVFVPTKPIKSDLQEVLGHGEHRKIELLTERYQMRITELEKEVIDDLKNKGINVAEELRKSLLRLNKEFVVEKIEELYLIKSARLQGLDAEIKELKTDIACERYQNYILYRYGSGEKYQGTNEEIQEMIDFRYSMKFELDDLEREYEQTKKFVEKYAEFF